MKIAMLIMPMILDVKGLDIKMFAKRFMIATIIKDIIIIACPSL
tara:strand:- start:30 stop:161 length:132 start_codon:yes stop_codon:yes gene_type:complete